MGDVKVPTPATSKQDYMTPPEFIAAVIARFGDLTVDLAASAPNVCDDWIGEEIDSLKELWAHVVGGGIGWLNPPFKRIDPWMEKCQESGCRVIALTPASLGSEWFVRRVQGSALTLVVRPRLTFVGERTPYPKDLAIHLFGFGMVGIGTWRWKP